MRVKTPTVIQMETLECGAAALGIILGYYKKFIPLEELREKCGVSRSGVNAYNMVQAAKYYGLEATGFRVEPNEIHQVELPAILHWDDNHFVVLEGFKDEKVYINDPAIGPNVISLEEFRRRYSQIAIEMKPGESFKKQGSSSDLWVSLKERLVPFKDALLYIFLLQFILVFLAFSQPIFIQLFLDKILIKSIIEWKKEFLLLLLCIICLISGITWMQGKFLNSLQVRLGIRYSTEFLWHVLRLPLTFFSQRFGGEIIHRMVLNNLVADTLSSEIMLTAINVLLIGIYALIMFQYDTPITLVAIAVAVMNLFLLLRANRMRTIAYAKVRQEEAKSYGVSLDALQNMEIIKIYGNENFFFSRIAGYYTKNINALQEIGRKDIWLTTLSTFLQQMTNVFLLGFGVWRVMHGDLSVGMLFALQALMYMFLKPFDQLVGFGSKIQTLKIDLTRLDDVLKHREDPLVQERAGNNDAPQGNLEFKQVSYGYQPIEEPYIKDFNLSLKKGQWIGLTGRVGSGKSTIIKLAASLYPPWSGQILYDQKLALDYPRDRFIHSLSMVDQTIFLFSGTIRQNLTLWDNSIPDERIIQAAKEACIHDEIISFPQGYQTILAENGQNISQGQRQRLEIARALILEPTLLLFDEATSSIDAELEEKILKNIKAKGISCLMAGHRLSALRECDEILVLEKGAIVEKR